MSKPSAFVVIIFIGLGGVANNVAGRRCKVPHLPSNIQWSNADKQQGRSAQVEPGTTIYLSCIDKAFHLDSQSIIKCRNNGKWSSKFGRCVVSCPPLKSTVSTLVSCSLNNKPLTDCLHATNGTIATLKCAPFYENPVINRNPFRVCQNGAWNQEQDQCQPICGVKPKNKEARFPWNVAIFRKLEDGQKVVVAAATLISERVLLTAAHIIEDFAPNKKKTPLKDLSVVAAKTTDNFNSTVDKDAQISEVEAAYIPDGYTGSIRKYAKDIAVIIAKTPFKLNQKVQPACVDFTGEFQNEFDYPRTKALMAGPLNAQFWPNIRQVAQIEVPIVNDSTCYDQLAGENYEEPDFRAFYSLDKFCSGYINSDKSPRCNAFIGAGLVSENSKNSRFYITGVASNKPSVHGPVCDNKTYVLFINVSNYIDDLILPKMKLYQPIKFSNYIQDSCGIKSVTPQTLIVNGNVITKGDYPWQVALYAEVGGNQQLVCGGSLLNTRLILTAAHCVSNHNNKLLPKEMFTVAVGKYFRNYSDPLDNDAQFSKVRDIFIPSEYQGIKQNYLADIAIIIAENSFQFSRNVQPICVDWENKFENDIMGSNSKGYVPGWGYTKENQKASNVLRDAEVPYIDQATCKQGLPPDYDIYLTSDKICAGYLNKSVNVCKGDSGGGLVFRNKIDGRYYITGIVSLSPQAPTGGCNSQQYGLYTRVSKYVINFILDKYRQHWA